MRPEDFLKSIVQCTDVDLLRLQHFAFQTRATSQDQLNATDRILNEFFDCCSGLRSLAIEWQGITDVAGWTPRVSHSRMDDLGKHLKLLSLHRVGNSERGRNPWSTLPVENLEQICS